MEKSRSSKKKIVAGAVVLVVLVAVLAVVYVCFMPKGSVGAKKITVTAVYEDESSDVFTISTEEEFLRGAMEQEGLIQGTESEYGLFVMTVNGVTVDYDKNQSWWCVTKGGETVTTGVDTTPIADGDKYEFTYTIGQ